MQTLKVREKKVSVHTYNYDNIIEFLNITKDILENPTVKQMKNFIRWEDSGAQMRLQGRFLAWIWYTQVTLYYPLLKLLAFGKNTFIRKGDTLGSVIVVLKMKRRENKF